MGQAWMAGVALGVALSSPGLAADRVRAFVDVGVIPMDREGVLLHQTVLVAADRITALGPAADVAVPPDAVRITGRGRYLLPGLTDAHVHLVSATELPLYLASGVTAVLNLHGQPAHLRWRAQVAEGSLAGPTIFSTGPIFDRLHTPEVAVGLIDDQAAAGYDGIKIYNQVGRAEYPALVAEAKKKGLLLMGHVAREPGFQATLAAGQSIAHAEELTYSAAGEEAVNALGYRLLGEDRRRDAIAVFQRNARTFARSANAEDSLAEAYAKTGDRPQALAHYRAALERDPGYANADFARGFVAAPSRP